MVCCMFGHRDAPADIRPRLEEVLDRLITQRQVDTVMVGRQGAFDFLAAGVICRLREKYPLLKCREVLAYLPRERCDMGTADTMLPEGIECVPPRFAISWRNRWMVDRSDIVVVYMTHSYGGTAAAANYALRKGKEVINIAI